MKFDESKVINALHTGRAIPGKKYFFADTITELKQNVESSMGASVLIGVDGDDYVFVNENRSCFSLIYPAPVITFDESKIIDTLHPEKAEVGKTYYFADCAHELKRLIESGNAPVGKYTGLSDSGEIFYVGEWHYYLLYPVD